MKSKKQTTDELVQHITQALNIRLQDHTHRLDLLARSRVDLTDRQSESASRIQVLEKSRQGFADRVAEMQTMLNDLSGRLVDMNIVVDLLYAKLKPKSKWMRFALWVDSFIGGGK